MRECEASTPANRAWNEWKLAVPEDMNEEKVGDLLEALIGELFLTYPNGKYEVTPPFRAVWSLPKFAGEATDADKAVMRLLALTTAVHGKNVAP